VFFSSHILSEVEEIADRVGIIRQGSLVDVLSPRELAGRALHRVRVRFGAPVPVDALAQVPGVRVIAEDDGTTVTLEVEGEMDALIKALAAYPVSIIETERPSLEETFLAYYR
jgi:ABC-2 type transport system ATP-binding protein